MKIIPIKRALFSVSNKQGIVEFAQALAQLNIEIISTGGTSQLLREAGVPHRQVEAITGMPEILEGRVKTLHPKIHGGILGRRNVHAAEAMAHDIGWIDLVVVNFYPFAEGVKDASMPWEEVVEYIDVGGPTMVRAAAKNFAWVGVVVNPSDYETILSQLRHQGGLDEETRRDLAEKAFALTSSYDTMIHAYFQSRQASPRLPCPEKLSLPLVRQAELRYGENPHQRACAYRLANEQAGVLGALQHQGKPLSYNNILDADAAWACVSEFDSPACVIVKHTNPCGVAAAATIDEAYTSAFQADPISAFGGIIALNRPCTKTIADAIMKIFMEVVIAPAFSDEALAILSSKPNLRLLAMNADSKPNWEMKFITGGVLWQEKDPQVIQPEDLKVVTRAQPASEDIDAMLFAWRVLKHIRSNGILISKQSRTVGIGAGQVSRIDAVDIAVRKAGAHSDGAVLASDAFFPFRDGIDRLAGTGIRAIIQPGGSVRDEEVIAACNEHGIAMVFTGKRCFRH